MLDLPAQGRRRRIGLTPMIDVVFLLLVFFMLAARFGGTDAIPLTLTGGDDTVTSMSFVQLSVSPVSG